MAQSQKSSRPLIGICARPYDEGDKVYIASAYALRVAQAGGIPIALPYGEYAPDMVEELITKLDGLVLTGGGDTCPESFGGDPYFDKDIVELSQPLPLRDQFEERLVHAAWDLDLPTLGICRGLQVLNTALGGKLWSDVRKSAPHIEHHVREPYTSGTHLITIEKDSKLAQILGTESYNANSMHHQAIAIPSPLCSVVAHADDGTIEGIEFRDKSFFVGVQWHPEIIGDTPQLFDAFVRAAEDFARKQA